MWNGDYPYKQVTAVDGTISAGGGMEYPNVTVIGNASSKEELEVVIVHEVGHNWFYGILGSNERVHGWMDEGMNTLNEMRYVQTKYPNNTRLSDMVLGGKFHFNDLDHHDMGDVSYRTLAILGLDQPIETHSAEFTPINYGVIMYQKTGLVFFYLKAYLGDELFNKAMSDYFEAWKFKHPQPEDMQKSIETSTGKKLDWLFNDLIKTTNHVDYKITCVKKDKSKNTTRVKVKNVGQVTGPIEVNAFKDTTLVETVWVEPSKKGEVTLKSTDYSRITIDDARDIPEINRGNNTWTKKSLLHKIEPIKFEFLIGDHEAKKTNLFWTPTIGGNLYDGFMLGAAVHNIGVPFKPFQFLIAPQFAFGRKNVSGIAELSYTFLPKKCMKISKFGASVKSFGTGNSSRDYYAAISPYWFAKLGNRGRAKATSHDLLIQTIFRMDQTSNGNTMPPFILYPENKQFGAFAQYNYNVNLPDHQFKLTLRADYMNGREKFDQLGRLSASVAYKYKYLKNKMVRWVEIRAFAGANILYKSQSGNAYNPYSLSFSGTPVVIGMTMFVQVNGVNRCVVYSRDDKNFSSNSNLGDIVQIYASCEYCSIIPTPTPTVTSTPTNTPSATASVTPSATATQTATPSQTATIGSTPPPTPTQTRTATATNTPTPSITPSPSATPTYVYVYQSCSPLGKNLVPSQVIQTQKVSFVSEINVTFKDSNNDCWFYVGRFDSTYIAPPTVSEITYDGNFFD
ncbi:MAG: hypothetical protein EBS86_07370, partial [Crocinitomicaceae bacterium]|nr:hypothetical protein [Crocinitomicaceae bacterium]